ncbi:MAG: DNA recombination/repair protein RecA [Clostridia bacterium]|nr:DNA recombination/repair protein RecA [Clostridia bacterium]
MAKTNKEAIMRLCSQIDKKEGEGSIFSLGSQKAILKIARWSTGIEDLDHIIGGGMPEGRVIEIFGPESSGKTTLLYHLLGRHAMALDIPVEGTFDADRAKVFGNRPKQLLIYRAKYGEEAFNKAIRFAQAGIPLIGIDSVPSLVPKDDVEKVLKAAEKDTEEEQRIGGVARLMNKYLPPLEEIMEVTGTTLVFINQVRDKMNAMMFGEKTDTPGGRKLKHACSLRIQVGRKGWIEIPNKDPKNAANTEKIGLIMKCKVVKSKVCNPMGECEIPLIFDRGFVSFDDVPNIRKELMKARGASQRQIEAMEEEDED